MSASASASSDASWAVAAEIGASPVFITAQPDDRLHAQVDAEGTVWTASSEHAYFRIPLEAGLPAGWYELRGSMECIEGTLTLPSLHPNYPSGAFADDEIPLPDPDRDGTIRVLVLFKYRVNALRFRPSVWTARFRMRDMSLQRISRAAALRMMLVDGFRENPEPQDASSVSAADGGVRQVSARTRYGARWRAGAIATSLFHFGTGVFRDGLQRATDALFEDYLRRLRPQGLNDYELWTRKFDTVTESRLVEFRQRARACAADGPLISVLLPVYRTPEPWLRRCIDSVLAQAYTKWELCIADDASPDPHVMRILNEYAQRDERIRVRARTANGHISAATNTALDMAGGDYVALLDHDDELRPHALLEMAEAIGRQPHLQLLYSDEDKLDAEGHRFDPHFKPDWNPDLLLSQNYVCHFTIIRANLVREVGGMRAGFEGSQDHDLVLRCSERLEDAQIHHVPRILYHWRAIAGSTALVSEAKDYASAAGAKAVSEHLQRIGVAATVEELPYRHYRVHWPMSDPAPAVSLIVPTRDRVDLLRQCVESVLANTDYPAFDIVVVDNQSREGSTLDYLSALARRDRVRVLRYDAPFNYAALNNWAVAQCKSELVCLLNNDVQSTRAGWLRELASHALRADVGAVGAMLYYPDETIQHAGVILGVHGVAGHVYAGQPRGCFGHGGRATVVQDLSAVTGACLMVRRELYEQLGGLDERLAVAFNDIDFCLRLRERGYRNVWTPFAEMYHHESASRGSEDTPEKKARFAAEVAFMQDRWGDALRVDPAYNPNLSLQGLDFQLAFPPRVAPCTL